MKFMWQIEHWDGFRDSVPRRAAVNALSFSENMSRQSIVQFLDKMEATLKRDQSASPVEFVGSGDRVLRIFAQTE